MTLPLFHSFGQTVQMNAGLGGGATLVLLPRFDAGTALALMERERVTFFAGVPTMYWGLLNVGQERATPAIAANLRMAILEQVEKVYGRPDPGGYGLSETSPVASFNHPGRGAKPGSIGQPIWGCR